MPGAGFQKKAREWRRLSAEMRDAPFDAVKNALVSLFMLVLISSSPTFIASYYINLYIYAPLRYISFYFILPQIVS